MKILVEREVLHQLARGAAGTQKESLSQVMKHKIADAARQIADATAIPENGPVQINTQD